MKRQLIYAHANVAERRRNSSHCAEVLRLPPVKSGKVPRLRYRQPSLLAMRALPRTILTPNWTRPIELETLYF